MLRPATPLTILLFISFVLLLLSCLSTPVIKAIPLATFQGVDFGVFGYCKGSQCSGIRIGYTTSKIIPLALEESLLIRQMAFLEAAIMTMTSTSLRVRDTHSPPS